MALRFIVVGSTKEKYYKQSEQEYTKRLKKFVNLSYIEVGSSKKSADRSSCLQMEEINILKQIGKQDFVILLDEKGKQFTSREFAEKLNNLLVNNANLTFVIGGAFGFSNAVQQRADLLISLSKLTYPHHLVRTIFLEQLYRGFTILSGGNYHND